MFISGIGVPPWIALSAVLSRVLFPLAEASRYKPDDFTPLELGLAVRVAIPVGGDVILFLGAIVPPIYKIMNT
jgi:hypothetical protein